MSSGNFWRKNYADAETLKMKSSGPHKCTWQTYKAVTSPLLTRELLRLKKHLGMLCLIAILVKRCLLALQCHLVLEPMCSPERDKGYLPLPLIKNKNVSTLFVQLTGIHYIESQMGGFPLLLIHAKNKIKKK